jgi:hypothetical protein
MNRLLPPALIVLCLFAAQGCANPKPAAPMTADDVAALLADKPFVAMGSGDAVGQHVFTQEPALASAPVLIQTASTDRD